MLYYVSISFIDELNRHAVARYARPALSKGDAIRRVASDLEKIDSHFTHNGNSYWVGFDEQPIAPAYCYGMLKGSKNLRGDVKTLIEGRYEELMMVEKGGERVALSDWKYWGDI